MLNFNLELFLHERRLSIGDLSKEVKRPYKSIEVMTKRGTVKPNFIRLLESRYGDCSKYIIRDKKQTGKLLKCGFAK
jgi:hypothetical protein